MQAAFQMDMGDMYETRVMLVDDQPLFRAGLARALAEQHDLHVVADVGNPAEAIAVARAEAVDVAVIDVVIPSTTGVSFAAQLLELRPACKLLALSAIRAPSMIAAMLRSGATGYAVKTQGPADIVAAIRTVLAGQHYLPPDVSREAVLARVHGDGEQPHPLTRREREIFDLLIRGHSNDYIASRLFIARRTVETHRQRITKKLSTSITEMIRLAARQGALA